MSRSKSGKSKLISVKEGKKPARQGTLPKFNLKSRRKIAYLDRVMVAIFSLLFAKADPHQPHGTEISLELENIVDTIKEQVDANGETLGKRTREYVEICLDRLSRNRHIILLPFEDDQDDRRFKILADFWKMLSKVHRHINDSGLFPSLSKLDFDQYRALSEYFHQCVTKKNVPVDKCPTRRELVRELWQLRALVDARSEEVYTSQITANTSYHTSVEFPEDMEYDDIPQASGSSSNAAQTPLRKSTTLNQVTAYPSPESLPRQRAGSHKISLSSGALPRLELSLTPTVPYSPLDGDVSDDMDTGTDDEHAVLPVPESLAVSLPLRDIYSGKLSDEQINECISKSLLTQTDGAWLFSFISKARTDYSILQRLRWSIIFRKVHESQACRRVFVALRDIFRIKNEDKRQELERCIRQVYARD